MSRKILFVAFVWNQHQPYYLDTGRNEFILPWVRLHASKDYLQMVAILEEYPEIRQTFSLSPSLLEQIEGYLLHGLQDRYLGVMGKAGELSEAQKKFLLMNYFDIQWDKVIGAYPFYNQLLDRQGRVGESGDVEMGLKNFAIQDYLDLQVWFNLVWIDPEIRQNEPFLRDLVEKGRNFTEKEKEEVIRRQFDIMSQIIPRHRQLQQNGQIEIMTTAYYHPIIPLLVDNHVALRATPGLPLPQRFQFKEDAARQIEMATEQYTSIFGEKPSGFWPPEQAVSPEMISLLADQGFKWTVSDEKILSQSVNEEIYRDGYGHVLNPEVLYSPYMAYGGGSEMPIVFRDQHLSDRIGFVYQHLPPREAAGDLVHRLQRISENLAHSPGNYLVTIALDGENAWEWYKGDKTEFLHTLYRQLLAEPDLKTVTVNEFLLENPPRRPISHLATGSWVDHNLTRWIGTENKNTLWNYLLEARLMIQGFEEREEGMENLKKALRNIYIAEGSDFPWWVDSMPYHLAAPFEGLFRKHLVRAYQILGQEPPRYLYRSVLEPVQGQQAWDESSLTGPVSMAPGTTNF
ncbi:MAG TPA: glycoside hydrolase [Firmicutes bacterium]|nr:glycoside hydrolase [Bacillota bacterium]